MNHNKRFKSLKGKRVVMLLGNLIFTHPIVLEGKGLLNPAGLPARPLTDGEIVAAIKTFTVKELMEKGQAMLTYKWQEIPPPTTKN